MKTTKPRPQLYAYLGLNDPGKISLFVSTDKLNPVGTRLEKGAPLPDGALQTYDTDYIDQAWGAMMDLQKYFDKEASGKR